MELTTEVNLVNELFFMKIYPNNQARQNALERQDMVHEEFIELLMFGCVELRAQLFDK